MHSNLYPELRLRYQEKRTEKIWSATILVFGVLYVSYFAGQFLSYLSV